ncbi:hypothetical protein [Coleofasciculus sp. A1-SPW-01]|uniref:hypothetical protein n=1 Tax=Coleofasciculus sp. A1-SPW-01 TaxID=3070819 RepID=UPI004063E8A1
MSFLRRCIWHISSNLLAVTLDKLKISDPDHCQQRAELKPIATAIAQTGNTRSGTRDRPGDRVSLSMIARLRLS